MTIHVLNANTLGISKYDLTFVGLVEHGGRTYGITTTQMLELTGTDDDGADIDAYIETGKLDFGSLEEKRFARALVKDNYANALLLTTTIDKVDAEEEAAEASNSYAIPAKVGARQHARAVRLRRDLKAVGWAFKVANVDGGGMALRALSVEPEGIEIDV